MIIHDSGRQAPNKIQRQQKPYTRIHISYQVFFTTLEQTVEERTKCFPLEFGKNKNLSFGRCKQMKSFTELYNGLNNIE